MLRRDVSRAVLLAVVWLIAVSAAQSAEVVRFESKCGDKTVVICEPRNPRHEDRVVVRLLFRGREIVSMPTFETPYRSSAAAAKVVRVHWRKDEIGRAHV